MFWIAFSMGLFGSLHCLGMCGPIAMTIPAAHPGFSGRMLSVFVYNAGRILIYSLFGVLAGIIGKSVALAGYQQWLSIFAGIFILLFVFTPLSKRLSAFTFIGRLKNKFGELIRKRSISALFALGLINGLLPCGMVYIAFAGAAATGNITHGALFMAAFGAGTLPMMASITYLASFISINFRSSMRRIYPYIMGVMAVLLVVRGLNLGIPYLSPKASSSEVHSCCQKKENVCIKN